MNRSRAYAAHAIILKRRVRGEADRLLTVFTREHGKCTVMAKGIRRITSKRAPYLEIFTHAQLYLAQGKVWDIVVEVKPLHTFQEFRSSLAHISVAYYLAELVDALLPERQEHAELYEWLLVTLSALGAIDVAALEDAQAVFAQQLLRRLGYLSEEQTLAHDAVRPYIEQLIERRVRSYAFLTTTTTTL